MVDEGTSLNNSAMSKMLGEKWKLLSEDEKKVWKKTAATLKKEHAKMYPSYKYKPKKRTISSGSNEPNCPNLPMSPPTSNSSTSPHGSPQDGEVNDDSLGSLEDLDLLDVGDIEDNGIQDIIEEVMHENESKENDENVQPINVKNPRVLIPKLTTAVLAPKSQRSPLKTVQPLQAPVKPKPRPGPGRPRKNKINILKPVTKTVYRKTKNSADVDIKAFQEEFQDFNCLPPIKRVKLTEEEIMTILQQEEMSVPGVRRTESAKKVEEIEKELLEVDKMFSLEEENPPSVDNPRKFTELLEAESKYIGDIERTFAVFDHRQDEVEDKQLEFMKRLDTWGVTDDHEVVFNDYIDEDTRASLGIPGDWRDEELFQELDQRSLTETVFRNTWLPKFALKIRKDPYRAMLRSMNKRDPEFNIIW